MNHVGMLRTGNEIDFIGELMPIHVQHFDHIYFLDDSTDGTGDVVRSFPEVVWSARVDKLAAELGDDGSWVNREWVRQPVMERIIFDWGEGVWITYLHGDEVFWHCPQQVAERAEYFGRKATVWNPMHFFLHPSQKDDWEKWWMRLPVVERMRFYCPGDSQIGWAGAEAKQIKATSDLHYEKMERYRYYPHGVEDNTNPPPYPLYLHVGYRSGEQAMDRVRRNAESGFQPVHRGLLDNGPWVETLEGFSEVCEWNGVTFGKRDRPDLYTYYQCGHKRGGQH